MNTLSNAASLASPYEQRTSKAFPAGSAFGAAKRSVSFDTLPAIELRGS